MKNGLFAVLMLFACSNIVMAQVFGLALLKDKDIQQKVVKLIEKKHANHTVVREQIVAVAFDQANIIVAPTIATDEKNGGCYLHALSGEKQVGTPILIEKTEIPQLCVTVLAVYGCRQAAGNGIGVIYGIRLGSNNHYERGSYFEINASGALSENTTLSQKIGDISTVVKAKKILNCK